MSKSPRKRRTYDYTPHVVFSTLFVSVVAFVHFFARAAYATFWANAKWSDFVASLLQYTDHVDVWFYTHLIGVVPGMMVGFIFTAIILYAIDTVIEILDDRKRQERSSE